MCENYYVRVFPKKLCIIEDRTHVAESVFPESQRERGTTAGRLVKLYPQPVGSATAPR